MKFDLQKDWDKYLITALAATTAFGLLSNIVSHEIQTYVLGGLAVYYLWFK